MSTLELLYIQIENCKYHQTYSENILDHYGHSVKFSD